MRFGCIPVSPPPQSPLFTFLSLRVRAAPLHANPTLFCVSVATGLYAKGVAAAARGEPRASLAARVAAFETAASAVPPTRSVFNNTCVAILGVAVKVLRGETAFRSGDIAGGLGFLRAAVARSDALAYDEPPGWMTPARHALGALLLEAGRVAEALDVFRTDLGDAPGCVPQTSHPNNVYALHGLMECLSRAAGGGAGGEEGSGDGGSKLAAAVEAARARLAAAQALADAPVAAACACRRP